MYIPTDYVSTSQLQDKVQYLEPGLEDKKAFVDHIGLGWGSAGPWDSEKGVLTGPLKILEAFIIPRGVTIISTGSKVPRHKGVAIS
jgi:hypothetical protein